MKIMHTADWHIGVFKEPEMNGRISTIRNRSSRKNQRDTSVTSAEWNETEVL